MKAKSVITTKNAEKLMRWTIGHFKMKVPAEYDKTQGKVEFPAGICTMQATTDQLIVTVEATTSESLSWLKDIVGRLLLASCIYQPEIRLCPVFYRTL
ncbi:MAG: DUF2218 domain-containing protein, partial [Chloroflexota bacterium]